MAAMSMSFLAFPHACTLCRSANNKQLSIAMRSRIKVLGRILKVGVHIFKQGVQGSNVHDLFNPAGPRRSPFFPRKTPTAVQFHAVDVVMLTIH